MHPRARPNAADGSQRQPRTPRRRYFGAALFLGAVAYGCAQSAYDPAPYDGDAQYEAEDLPAVAVGAGS
jgi:hypothetical protein